MIIIMLSAITWSTAYGKTVSEENDKQCEIDPMAKEARVVPLESPSTLSLFMSSFLRICTEASAAKVTGWLSQDERLGLNFYRGWRCASLGLHGLDVYRNYSSDASFEMDRNRTLPATMQENNIMMLGYLAADASTMVLSSFGGYFDKRPLRTELLIHHFMGWQPGATVFPQDLSYPCSMRIWQLN